ncbi:MAG: glutathione S-transferase family protein [Alphaproteobacteria bacterium]|nr:glutathione S-transferase family protein [Alphaproteobacteria bacterium]
MSYTLYGENGSGAFCVEAALAEAGATYTFQPVSLDKNEQRSPAFLAINPSGKVPALRLPSGDIVTETAALLLVVAERYPDAGLLPPVATPARAQAMRWIAFMASEIYPMVEIADYPDRFVPAGAPAEALKLKVRDRIRARMLDAEQAVAGPWFLASGFSAVDIYAAMFSRWRECRSEGWREEHLPKICAVADALSQRPVIAPIWRKHFPKG